MDTERLITRIEDKRKARARVASREMGYKDHVRVITEAYEVTKMDFWCKECLMDFSADGYKQVRYAGRWPVAWYVGQCPEGHSAIRQITDKGSDTYYRESEMICRQRVVMADAMLTPDDPRFALVYPQQWREMEKARAEQNGI